MGASIGEQLLDAHSFGQMLQLTIMPWLAELRLTSVALVLLYLLPSSSIIQPFNYWYFTLHQVMSPNRRVYSSKKHLLYRPRNDKMQHGLVSTAYNKQVTSNSTLPSSSWWNYNPMLTMICSVSCSSDLYAVILRMQNAEFLHCCLVAQVPKRQSNWCSCASYI